MIIYNFLNPQRIQKLLFIFSFIILLVGVLFPQIILEQKRHITHSTDDHLAYVVKAANIKNCMDFKQNECAGLRSIYDQSEISLKNVGNKPYYPTRQIHRLTFSYHPLYSIALVGISNFFEVSLAKAQFIFEMIAAPLCVLGVAMFLYTFFGITVATIIMPFIAFHPIGTGWGIHHYAPFIIAIPPILIAMSLVVKNKVSYNIAALFLMFISSGFHPSGIVMSGAVVFFAFMFSNNRFALKQIFFYFSSIIVFFFYFDHIKFLNVDTAVTDLYRELDILSFVKSNINTAFSLIKWDSKIFFNVSLCLPFFFLGGYSIIKDKFKIDRLYPLLFTVLFIGFLATVFPSPTVSLFKRTWIILSLFTMGIMGYGVKVYFLDFIKFIKLKDIKSIKVFFKEFNFNRSYFTITLFMFIFLLTSINNLRQIYMHRLDLHIWDENIVLNEKPFQTLLKTIKKEEKIFFHFPKIGLSEPIIYHFLANGGNKVANIWPIINPLYKEEINPNVKYMLTLNPMSVIDGFGIQQPYFYRNKNILITGDVFIIERDNLEFKFNDKVSEFQIFVENIGRKASLVNNIDGSRITIPKNFKGWLTINLEKINNNKILKLFAEDVRKPIRIQGFKINKDQKTFYPWNKDFLFEKNNVEVSFKLSELSPVNNCSVDKIINDFGTSILTSLKCD